MEEVKSIVLSEGEKTLIDSYWKEIADVVTIRHDTTLPKKHRAKIEQRRINQILSNRVFNDYFGNDLVQHIKSDIRLEEAERNLDIEEDDIIYADEFLDKEFSALWLAVNYFVRDDFFIVAGEAKVGKSEFMTYLARCVLYDGKFLGLPCSKGKVLYFQCEENDISLKKKLKDIGFESFEVKEYIKKEKNFILVRSLDLYNDYAKFEGLITKYKPALVVIDTIITVMDNSGIDQKNPEFASIFRRVQKTARDLKTTVVGLHHLNKEGKIASTFALTSVGSGNMILKRFSDSEEDKRVSLQIKSRDAGSKEVVIERFWDSRRQIDYKFVEQKGIDPGVFDLQKQVLRYLYNNPSTSEKDLKKIITDDKLSRTLDYLCNSSLIDYRVKGEEVSYYLPYHSKALWDGMFTNLEENIEVSNKLLEFTTNEDIKAFTKEWTADYKRKIWGLLPDNDKFRVLLLLKTPKYHEQQVLYKNEIYNAEVQYYNKEDYIFQYKLFNEDKVLELVDEKVITKPQ